jgi:hypothetical protein
MNVCKKTGWLKYGTREMAMTALQSLPSPERRALRVGRCMDCNCLHLMPIPPDKIKPDGPPEKTKGVSGYVDLAVKRIASETDAAFFFELEMGEKVWFPKSQIADPDDYEADDEDLTVSVTEWILKQKGLPA